MGKLVKLVLIILTLFVFQLRARAQEEIIAGKNNTVSVPGFSIIFPARCLGREPKWYIVKKSEEYDAIELEAQMTRGPFKDSVTVFTMKFFLNPILSDSIRNLTPEQIANDIRKNEVGDMQDLGVTGGNYKLEEVKLNEDTIEGKLFYILSYITSHKINGEGTQLGWLYLYFPKETGNEYVFSALLSEFMISSSYSKKLRPLFKVCFREMIGSLILKE